MRSDRRWYYTDSGRPDLPEHVQAKPAPRWHAWIAVLSVIAGMTYCVHAFETTEALEAVIPNSLDGGQNILAPLGRAIRENSPIGWMQHAAEAERAQIERIRERNAQLRSILRPVPPTPPVDPVVGPPTPLAPAAGDSVAFPGALGFGAGALTSCNRDSVYVHVVTSTANGGTGTLDSALNHQHPDTLDVILFATGGWHTSQVFEGKLDCTYIAGQTAPGGGFGMTNGAGSVTRLFRIYQSSKDFVFRGLTFTGAPRNADTSTPLFNVEDASNFIFAENDHFWGTETNLSVILGANANDRLQYGSFIRQFYAQPNALEPTSNEMGMLEQTDSMRYLSITRTLYASSSHRNPTVSNDNQSTETTRDDQPRVRAVGNMIYNQRQGAHYARGTMTDFIDILCKSGPMTLDGVPSGDDLSWCTAVSRTKNADSAQVSLYVERIIGVHNRDTLANADSLWASGGGHQEVAPYAREVSTSGGGDPYAWVGNEAKRATPITPPTFAAPRINPLVLQDSLAGTASDSGRVGNHRGVDCSGTWYFRSDSAHAALLKEVRDSTGISSSAAVDSAFVALRHMYTKAAGTACSDSDSDGMPNAFEVRIQGGTDSTGAAVNGDPDADGFTNVEEYANGTDPLSYDGASESGGGGPPVTCSTYSGGRCVFVFPLVSGDDTLDISGTDTSVLKYRPDFDSVPKGTLYLPWFAVGHDSALVLTCDPAPSGGSASAQIDSLKADSIFVAWGLTVSYPWAATPPADCP